MFLIDRLLVLLRCTWSFMTSPRSAEGEKSTIRITLPMNQKLTIFTHNTVIQDSLDDILIVFCVDGGWFWRDTPRKENGVIVMSTFKATGVDFGMDLIFV